MIEKQNINGREVWIKVDAHPVERDNPNTIPREYFSASCFSCEPGSSGADGEQIRDEDGSTRMFESPVAALTEARKQLEININKQDSIY